MLEIISHLQRFSRDLKNRRRRLLAVITRFVRRQQRFRAIVFALANRIDLAFEERKKKVAQRKVNSVRGHEIDLADMSSLELRKRTRFTRKQFENLLQMVLNPFMRVARHRENGSLTAGQVLYLLLRKLAFDATYENLALEVGSSAANVWKKIHTMAVIMRCQLRPFLVRPQSSENVKATMESWENRFGLPLAYIHDGCHFDKKGSSRRHKVHFWNRHKRSSQSALIVEGSHNLIAFASLGYPGRCHDSNIFRRSTFGRLLEKGLLTGAMNLTVGGVKVNPMTMCDSAYKLTKYVLVPCKGKYLPRRDRIFRTRLSRLRTTEGEQTHGILKARWRYLLNKCRDDCPSQVSLSDAAIISHNFLVVHTSKKAYVKYLESCESGVPALEGSSVNASAKRIRQAFMDHLHI